MFKSGKDNMRMDPTPERVYALCRFMQTGEYTRENLYEHVSMTAIFGDGSQDIFGATLKVALELDLLVEKEGKFRLIKSGALDSYDEFRRYTANTALSRVGTLFYSTTSLYLKLAEQVLKCQSWGAVASLFIENGVEVAENDILGWRFWVSFFGLGYLHQTMLIPNSYNRLRDVLIEKGQNLFRDPIPVPQFIDWVETQCPETRESREDTQIGLAVSNGLRTLHFKGEIELVSQPDATKWKLYGLESETINDISHVRIVR